MLTSNNDPQAAYNARNLERFKAEQRDRQRKKLMAGKADREHMEAVRGVQWRTRLTAVERKLLEVKTYLRYDPQNADLRAEAEALEEMYLELMGAA